MAQTADADEAQTSSVDGSTPSAGIRPTPATWPVRPAVRMLALQARDESSSLSRAVKKFSVRSFSQA